MFAAAACLCAGTAVVYAVQQGCCEAPHLLQLDRPDLPEMQNLQDLSYRHKSAHSIQQKNIFEKVEKAICR